MMEWDRDRIALIHINDSGRVVNRCWYHISNETQTTCTSLLISLLISNRFRSESSRRFVEEFNQRWTHEQASRFF